MFRITNIDYYQYPTYKELIKNRLNNAKVLTSYIY